MPDLVPRIAMGKGLAAWPLLRNLDAPALLPRRPTLYCAQSFAGPQTSRTKPLTFTTDITAPHYRDAMAHFAGHVHVVTTDGPAGRRGTTVIAACSVSDDPPTVLVCLNRDNANNAVFFENKVFALNALALAHQPMATAFAGMTGLPQEERFALGDWTTLASGSPVLKDALAVFDFEVAEAHDFSTHRVLFGKVTGLAMAGSVEPLIYFNRAWRSL